MAKRVLVISARMGAGHDGAARELCLRLRKRGHETRMLDFLDASPRIGRFLKKTYELQLSKAPWTYDLLYRVWTWSRALTPPLVFVLSVFFERRLRRWAKEFDADLIVTTYPFASVVLGRARLKKRNRLTIPVSTFLTDFAVHPLWVHKGVDSHICVHPRAAQAVYNLTGEFATAPGPLVSSAFVAQASDKQAARTTLGIPLDATAVLVVAGSWGVGELEKTFDALTATRDFLPIVICGRNEELAQRLRGRNTGIVLGWTDQMATYMQACDVVVQNAGGLTCMEAFASGLPVVSYRPIPGHGRQNTFEMTAAELTHWARGADGLKQAILEMRHKGDKLAKNALSMFSGDAADEVERLLQGFIPSRIAQARKPRTKRYASLAAAAIMLFVSTNFLSNIATDDGLNVAPVSFTSARYVYLTVLVSPKNIDSPDLITTLAHNEIGAIITGKTALATPAAVSRLANSGVAIINGGWDDSSDLHIITPDNAAAHTMSLLQRSADEKINIYAPQMVVNTVDLAWATLHHQTIIRPTPIRTGSKRSAQRFAVGQIYELNASSMTVSQAITELDNLISELSIMGFKLYPIWTLR